jgi:hypothetical protein
MARRWFPLLLLRPLPPSDPEHAAHPCPSILRDPKRAVDGVEEEEGIRDDDDVVGDSKQQGYLKAARHTNTRKIPSSPI